jgi:hypothetical protein
MARQSTCALSFESRPGHVLHNSVVRTAGSCGSGHGVTGRQLPLRLVLRCGVTWQTHRTASLRGRPPRLAAWSLIDTAEARPVRHSYAIALKAGPAGGRLRRPSSRRQRHDGATGTNLTSPHAERTAKTVQLSPSLFSTAQTMPTSK